MEDFTRDVLEITMHILVSKGRLLAEDAELFIADIDGDADATHLLDVLVEQARLVGVDDGYEEGFEAGADSNTGWDEDEDDDE